jgi:hypothetical protein
MEDKETELIERLKAAVSGKSPPFVHGRYQREPLIDPPVSQGELARAEEMLGFELPSLLRRIYLEVGNGGFDLAYELFPLSDEHSEGDFDAILQSYLSLRSATQEDINAYWKSGEEKPSLWPEKLLMVSDWGCSIYSYIDCASPECRVLRSDGNISAHEFAIESPSLYQWLEDWLNKTFHFDWNTAEKITFW